MTVRVLAIVLATSALSSAAWPAVAQVLDPQFRSPDLAVAPPFASAIPNNGAPVPSVQAITDFGRVFGFGSSSTDTRSSVPVAPGYGIRNSNGNAVAVELLAPIIGATNRPGSLIPLANPAPTNFAIGGTTSRTALPQVGVFQGIYGRFAPNDVAFLWSGINDWSLGGVNATNVRTVASNTIANQAANVRQFINLGARNVVVIGQAPFGSFQAFHVDLSALGIAQNDANAVTTGSQLVDSGLEANLAGIRNQSGANIHYVNTTLFISQIRANPTLYGFSAAGVQPNVNCVSLQGFTVPSCPANASFAVQNQFLSWDGIHYTNRFHTELAQVIANQIIAPYTVAPQAAVGGSTSAAFASALLLRLDAYRTQNAATGGTAPTVARPFSVFVEGGYNNANRDARLGGPGFEDDQGSLTVGGEYRVNPGLLVGAAFNYASPTVRLTTLGEAGNSRTSLNAYQVAAFASLNQPDWYTDVAVGYGFDNYSTRRDGLVDQLTANPGGNTLFAAAKGAYLVNVGGFRLGPLANLTYSKVWIDKYTESGDPLLTQSVNGQNTDSLLGAAGIQVRRPFPIAGHVINPFVNLTAEREFMGGSRFLLTAQTYALDLPTTTKVRGYGGGTYGRFAAGASMELGAGFSAMLNGSSTFARKNGDDYLLNGGIKYGF